MAARWAEILDRPLERAAGDIPAIQLGNARLTFVLTSDGRGEGLGGVDLEVVDAAAVLTAAEARGCGVSGPVVTVCGTRFHLS